jgi:hypothetical protein
VSLLVTFENNGGDTTLVLGDHTAQSYPTTLRSSSSIIFFATICRTSQNISYTALIILLGSTKYITIHQERAI